ncbi:sialin [Condylostylus longicornis]|uniref:sialin n=1 Tax=Condylostylus longicornis TaxID=2530218 RepID=UPI00244E5806|nr:sialin [Condylostylus longicornis]
MKMHKIKGVQRSSSKQIVDYCDVDGNFHTNNKIIGNKNPSIDSSSGNDNCNNSSRSVINNNSTRRNYISEKVPARLVLYFLSWSGFLVSFMMRNDINFALLAMVRTNNTTLVTETTTRISTFSTTTIDTAINGANITKTNSNDLNIAADSSSSSHSIKFQDIIKTNITLMKLENIIDNNDENYKNFNNNDNVIYKNDSKKNLKYLNLTRRTAAAIESNILNNNNNSYRSNNDNDTYNDIKVMSKIIDTNEYENYGEYDWSSTIKATILGSFYWCYVLSQVVGGVATQYFGTKNVFGWSQLATAICSLFIPYASDIHYGAVIFLRSIQGFASGLTWPAMYAIVGYWIPEIERSRFMSSFQGFSIGIGLTYPLCGFIIKNFGWRYVFYTTGTIGCLWCVMWYFLAFNTPEEHPRITKSELNYISKNINNEIKNSHGMKVPWINIFKSLSAWSIGITTFGRIWVHYQFIMSGPNYMKNILGFSIQSNGLLSGLPFLFSYITSVSFCYMADYFVTKNWMSLTNVRKLFTATSQIIPGLMLLMIGYINDNIIIVLIIWFIAVTLIPAAYAGAMANIVDIAPNLAGPVLAFAQTIHMTASFLSPVITGFIVTNENSIMQWRTVFGLSFVIAFCTYIMFQIYGTATIQSWNYPKNKLSSFEEREFLSISQIGEEEQPSNNLTIIEVEDYDDTTSENNFTINQNDNHNEDEDCSPNKIEAIVDSEKSVLYDN